MKTTVYIIEDDFEFGSALQLLISSNPLLEVAGIGSTLEKARQHITAIQNDIYLIDITLPDGSGIDMMSFIRARYPNSKILALSTLGDEKHILSSIEAGASGYFLKSEMPSHIIQSIISLINDGGYLSGHASKVLINRFLTISTAPHKIQDHAENFGIQHRSPDNAYAQSLALKPKILTNKELEVLIHLQKDCPSKIIADNLNISIFTVNQHLRSIYRKFNVRNKMEAVQSARLQGLL